MTFSSVNGPYDWPDIENELFMDLGNDTSSISLARINGKFTLPSLPETLSEKNLFGQALSLGIAVPSYGNGKIDNFVDDAMAEEITISL